MITRVSATGSSGAGWPVSASAWRSSAVILGGLKKRAASGKMKAMGAGSAAARASKSARVSVMLRADHSRRQASRIQRPMTFFRNRTVPDIPISLVKFAASASGPRIGAGRSTPTSDQVPDDTKAHPAASGVPATALAVSCVAG